jgi:hypothetical protein
MGVSAAVDVAVDAAVVIVVLELPQELLTASPAVISENTTRYSNLFI